MNPWEELLAHATRARVKDEHGLMEMIAADKLERLEAENARLRNVLSIYANPAYWQATQGDDQEYIFCQSAGMKIYVQGKAARAALEGK
jgi:hypothetical protein